MLTIEQFEENFEVSALKHQYERKGVSFPDGYQWAYMKATQGGTKDPVLDGVITELIKYMFDYLADTLEKRLPEPKTFFGRLFRRLLQAL